MADPIPQRRMAENEVYFRQRNENMQQGIDDLKNLAHEQGHDSFIDQSDSSLHFYCECSDENCRERVVVHPSDYDKIHKYRDRFIVVPGHEVPEIEHVVAKTHGYYVVEKDVVTPEVAKNLHETDVDNANS